MNNKLLNWIHVNPAIVKRLDAGEKNLITILALSVPVSSVVAGIVFFYSIQLLLESNFLAFIVSLFLASLLFLHDSTLLSEVGTGRAVFRLFLSAMIALIVAIPLKIKFMGDAIEAHYLADIEAHNNAVNTDLMEAKEAIYAEGAAMDDAIVKAGEKFDRTRKGQAITELHRKRDAFSATGGIV